MRRINVWLAVFAFPVAGAALGFALACSPYDPDNVGFGLLLTLGVGAGALFADWLLP